MIETTVGRIKCPVCGKNGATARKNYCRDHWPSEAKAARQKRRQETERQQHAR